MSAQVVYILMAPSWLDKLADNQQGITTQVADVTGHRFNCNYDRRITCINNDVLRVTMSRTM